MNTHRDVGVPGVPLGVGGGEDGVDEDEGADDLSAEAVALGVAGGDDVGAAAVAHVQSLLEALDDAGAADGAQALHDDVEDGPGERQLPRQEQAEGHRRVDVAACGFESQKLKNPSAASTTAPARSTNRGGWYGTGDAGGAVDEGEDHSSEGPGDALDADGGALGLGIADAHDGEDADVEEEEGGAELGDAGAVEGPGLELPGLEQRRRRGLLVVLVIPGALRRRPDGLPLRELVGAQANVLLLALHLFSLASLFPCALGLGGFFKQRYVSLAVVWFVGDYKGRQG